MTQCKLLLAITVIALLVVSGLFIPTDLEVTGQEQQQLQQQHSTNRTSLSAQLQESSTSVSSNQSSVWIDSFNLENCDLTSTGANTYFILMSCQV
jgi:hypothetical protein